MAGGGYTLGLVGVLGGAYLIDCAVQGRPPIGTLKDLIADPSNIRATLASKNTSLSVPAATANNPTVTASAAANSKAAAAVAFARNQIGKPYRWGARGPDYFDCSGLTLKAYESVGVKIGVTSTLQLANGTAVKQADLIPGDLIWPHLGHVQIYSGGGYVIEAPKTGLNVREVKVWGFLTARRIIPTTSGVDYVQGTAENSTGQASHPSIRSVTGSAG